MFNKKDPRFLSKVKTILIILFAFTTNITIAQFAPAYSGDQSSSAMGNMVTRTGNDVAEFGAITMHVYVWDDGGTDAAFLGWDDGNGNKGTINLNNSMLYFDVYNTDVALVKNNGDSIYAIVAYSSLGSGIMVDYFLWNGGSFVYDVSNSPSNTLGSLSYGNIISTINIDADQYGNFIIVWDDNFTNDIQVIGGTTSVGPPVLGCGPVDLVSQFDTTYYCTMPDVSIWSSAANNSNLYFTYVAPDGSGNPDTLYVTSWKFWYLMDSCYINSHVIFSKAFVSDTFFYNPRIATPNHYGSVTYNEDWTVVATAYDNTNSDFHIYGYTQHNYSINAIPHDYTKSGTNVLFNYKNRNPAVSYDYASSTILAGWTSSYGGNLSAFEPPQPIVVRCDSSGSMVTTTNPYMIVPLNANVSSGDNQYALSIAGRFCSTSKMIYTWYNNNLLPSQDVYYKYALSSSTNLRFSGGDKNGMSLPIIFPNPTSSEFRIILSTTIGETVLIELWDIFGQKVYSSTEHCKTDFMTKEISIKGLGSGIYIASISNGITTYKQKIILEK